MTSPLRRTAGGPPAAPVRLLHLGLGSFFRAHQAWYTAHAPDAADWGIAAFTGRSPAAAAALAAQDGLYTLVTRGPRGDAFEVVPSLSAVHPGSDHAAWTGYWRCPELAAVTLTVTEAGYARDTAGGLDLGRADVRADVAALAADPGAAVATPPARLVAGLAARRAANGGPIAVVPCDNLPGNGAVAARVVGDLATAVDPALARWVSDNVRFVSTVVDRITPVATEADRRAVLAGTGVLDSSPVPTEPFSEWVLAGEFPAGRPAWEVAGARFVDDVAPFAERKLALLNGAHSLMAYAATIRGHATVAAAVADPVVLAWVEEFWDEACRHLALGKRELGAYRAALLIRFANPRIRHTLAQIAADGSQKMAVRIVATVRAEVAAGRIPPGATRAVAAWVAHLRGHGAPVSDVASAELIPLVAGDTHSAVAAVLGHLGLGGNPRLAAAVTARLGELVGVSDPDRP